jgi:hypothetical protein
MRHIWLAAAGLLLAVGAAQARLEFQDIKAVQGLYGPERKNLEIYPGDEIFLRFLVVGIRVDNAGKVDGSVSVRVSDGAGRELLNQKSELRGVLALGGQSLQSNAFVNFGETVTPGEYTLAITVTDNLSKETASFTRKVTCRPAEFAIVAPRFFYDGESKVQAPPGGLVGQTLHLTLKAIGYEHGEGKVNTAMKLEVLDSQGKPVLPEPIVAEYRTEDPERAKASLSVAFRGSIVLNRAGDFILRVTVTDRLGKRNSGFEVPMKVVAP